MIGILYGCFFGGGGGVIVQTTQKTQGDDIGNDLGLYSTLAQDKALSPDIFALTQVLRVGVCSQSLLGKICLSCKPWGLEH